MISCSNACETAESKDQARSSVQPRHASCSALSLKVCRRCVFLTYLYTTTTCQGTVSKPDQTLQQHEPCNVGNRLPQVLVLRSTPPEYLYHAFGSAGVVGDRLDMPTLTVKFRNPASGAEQLAQLQVLFGCFYAPAVRQVSSQDACIVVHCSDLNTPVKPLAEMIADGSC